MNAFKKTLVVIAAAATLAATALGSTEASAWCGDSGYHPHEDSSYGDSSYGYDYGSYDGYDRHDHFEHRGFGSRNGFPRRH